MVTTPAARQLRSSVRAVSVISSDRLFVADDFQVMQLSASSLEEEDRWIGHSDNPVLSLTAGVVPVLQDDDEPSGEELMVVVFGHMCGQIVLRRAFASTDEEDACLGKSSGEVVVTRRLNAAVRAVAMSGSVLVAGDASGSIAVLAVALADAGRRIHCQTLSRLHAPEEVEALAIAPAAASSCDAYCIAVGRSTATASDCCGLSVWDFHSDDGVLPETWRLTDDDGEALGASGSAAAGGSAGGGASSLALEASEEEDRGALVRRELAALKKERLAAGGDGGGLFAGGVFAVALAADEACGSLGRLSCRSGGASSGALLLLAGGADGTVALWRLYGSPAGGTHASPPLVGGTTGPAMAAPTAALLWSDRLLGPVQVSLFSV